MPGETHIGSDRLARVIARGERKHDPFLPRVATPVDEAMRREEEQFSEFTDARGEEERKRLAHMITGAKLFIRDCCRDGLNPQIVMKQFFARADMIVPEIFAELTLEQRAAWFGETKQNYSIRRKNVLRRHGLPDTGFACMKGSTANYRGRKAATPKAAA